MTLKFKAGDLLVRRVPWAKSEVILILSRYDAEEILDAWYAIMNGDQAVKWNAIYVEGHYGLRV